MAAVNWFCLVLAFAFINNYVCIKVDPNGTTPPNGNYTTISLNSQTILPYTKSTIYASTNSNEPRNNLTLLGDTELSASERTRRLIPYMAFYVPVSELPINKQYASKNNIHATQKQQLARPSATGTTGGSHIPIPPQYVHSSLDYLPPAPSSHAGPSATAAAASASPSGQPYYQPNAGLGLYGSHGYVGGQQQQHQHPQQFHLLPPTTGHAKHPHIQPPGPPGPSATGFPQSLAIGHGKGNGKNNHNAFAPYKEILPIRHKTVQHFPPLSSTASTAVSAPSSAVAYENVRQTSSGRKQQKQSHRVSSNSGNGAGIAATSAVYRPRTQQSKINLTPFTPSNSVPGNFVPIVYTPVNSNNKNNNNNILNSQAVSSIGGEIVDSTSYNHEENQLYHKQQLQNPTQHQHHQPQQIAIEYSSGLLPPSASASPIPIDVQAVTPQRPHHPHHHQQLQQQQHQQYNHHNPKQQSQQQYYSVTTSPVNVDLTHDVVTGLGGVGTGGAVLNAGVPVNVNYHSQHHPPSVHNTNAISPPPTIYHQNQQEQQQQLLPEHVINDASLRTSQQQQTLTGIGSQQQQRLYNNVGKSAIQFQPPKPESFFDSELHLQQQHHQQQQNIEQVVLKDVNSNVSQMMTPQEKYVMYLQQRIRYNKHQQRQQATRQKYRERNTNKDKQHQQNPTQIFVLSSTVSPSPLLPSTHVSPDSITALAPIRPAAQPSASSSSYDSNYPQHSPIHHDLYPRPIIKPLNNEDGIRTIAPGTGGEGSGTRPITGGVDVEEQVLTIPVHSLFGEFDTLQKPHNHYSLSHSVSPSSSHQQHHTHKSQYTKNGAGKPQYIDYIIDEPKQSLDDEQHYQRQKPPQQQLELLKPTLGPPSHAFILVTTPAPFLHEPVTQENYGSSLRPPYKNKPKIRLQPVLKENNVNYATIREQNPTERPQVVAITPTANKAHVYHEENDVSPKYVYVKEEFGQKLSTSGGGAVKLKPSNKYENDNNQIPQEHHHHHHHQQQHQQPDDNIALQPLAPRQPTTTHHSHQQQQELDDNEAVSNVATTPPKTILADPNELPDIRTSSLAEILHKLQESNHLPHTLTPDNIDNSIKTLIRILNNLKQTQTIVANPPQHHETPAHPPPSSPDYDYTNINEEDQQQPQTHNDDISLLTPTGPNKHPGPSTGRPGIDYPNYAEIPQTSFDCSEQRYKGFFGDPETNCQVWHYCDLNGGKASFLCPNGTIFSQIALTCDWWFNVKCATTPQLYVLNERLYKYILPFTPKFPEDYSGPIVDKYLAMKFQEMEEKMRLEKEKALKEEAESAERSEENVEPLTEDSKEDNHLEETTTTEDSNHKNVKLPTNKHETINSLVSEQSSERNLLIDDEVDNISERNDALEKFESTTIASITATVKPETVSFSLKPIIVSSTLGPDYDEEQLQHHDNEKRSNENLNENAVINKTDKEFKEITSDRNLSDDITQATETVDAITSTMPTANRMHITVEKVDVIEIKPDGATGHLIRDMLMNSKQTTN